MAKEKAHPQEEQTPSKTPLLDQVHSPADMKSLSDEALSQLSAELRQATIEAVSKTGGHLGAGLGVVELTTALHAVFDTPKDKIIFDVGHQTYPHKILTGRRDRIHTLRQGGGLSGFTKRDESEYDPFGAAHSSTSLSAALGMAKARDLKGEDHHIIAVIGDGALSAGMAYEALNNVASANTNLIVIVNDNDMSIAPPVGAMAEHLRGLKGNSDRENIFEIMGFDYHGPIDGHDMSALLPALRKIRDHKKGPILLHVKTEKGHGFEPAKHAPDKMHGVAKFDVVTGNQEKQKDGAPTYTKVFAESLIKEAREDKKIIGITAAMPDGTGLDLFAREFPDRFFDVGIAEQHAVTFAAGLAAEGMKPFAAIYSTFLQRSYDQIIHDVAIQNLPVRFAIDRAGLVGADGATHAGAFDIAALRCVPNMVLMAAGNEAELQNMVATAAAYDAGPIAFRYPRGAGTGITIPDTPEILEIGKGRIVFESGKTPHPSFVSSDTLSPGEREASVSARGEGKKSIAILSYGARLSETLKAAGALDSGGHHVAVADMRFVKPLDEALIRRLTKEHEQLITIEEGSCGGFGAAVLEFLSRENLMDGNLRVRTLTLPDRLQEHDTQEKQYDDAGLLAESIYKESIN